MTNTVPNKISILVLQGGPSQEHAVSLSSGKNVLRFLDAEKYHIFKATILKNGMWRFGDRGPRYTQKEALNYILNQRIDVVFIALHGRFGEDGELQALFEKRGIKYTGSSPRASRLAMDKAASARAFHRAGLIVPPFVHVRTERDLKKASSLLFPLVVKPCHGGSSIGVRVVKTLKAAIRATQKILTTGDSVILQQQIVGREFTCGVLEDADGQAQALPPTEIIPKATSFFDYHAKYVPGASREITPASIPLELTNKIQYAALTAHRVLQCSGMSRSDFLWDGKALMILETNTIPGLTATSLLPQAANAVKINFPRLLDRIVASVLR